MGFCCFIYCCFLVFLLLLFITSSVIAQNKQITGKVINKETGAPLEGLSVMADKTTQGVVTKADGTYSISVKAGTNSLVFSFVGFETKIVSIGTKKNIDVFSLLKNLHPSAAVCGTPRNKAFDIIEEIEGMNRGRYAGPVGWVDASGDGELGIALRSGQIAKNQIRIFAGCGIVSGSDPDIEVAESLAKFAAMQSALN